MNWYRLSFLLVVQCERGERGRIVSWNLNVCKCSVVRRKNENFTPTLRQLNAVKTIPGGD